MEKLPALARSISMKPRVNADDWAQSANNSNGALAMAAIAGAGVGIMIGLLLAPCPGRELRQALRNKLGRLYLPHLDDQKMIDIELERMTGEGGIG